MSAGEPPPGPPSRPFRCSCQFARDQALKRYLMGRTAYPCPHEPPPDPAGAERLLPADEAKGDALSHAGHVITRCECGIILSQCRCIDQDKPEQTVSPCEHVTLAGTSDPHHFGFDDYPTAIQSREGSVVANVLLRQLREAMGLPNHAQGASPLSVWEHTVAGVRAMCGEVARLRSDNDGLTRVAIPGEVARFKLP